jgi:RNA polymerase sigma factor (TIGR02999 family)
LIRARSPPHERSRSSQDLTFPIQMQDPQTHSVTNMLQQAGGGDAAMVERLSHLIMGELRSIARRALRHESPGHTLQPTLLADEAFMRLVPDKSVDWQSRSHFYALAARNIRQLLVDHARGRDARKRGGGAQRVSLQPVADAAANARPIDLLELDSALEKLAQLHSRQARLIELRFFGGLTTQQAADLLGVSKRTADEDWHMARAWLTSELGAP